LPQMVFRVVRRICTFRHLFLISERCSVAINYHVEAFSSRMVDVHV
jgi:hypothetical protein